MSRRYLDEHCPNIDANVGPGTEHGYSCPLCEPTPARISTPKFIPRTEAVNALNRVFRPGQPAFTIVYDYIDTAADRIAQLSSEVLRLTDVIENYDARNRQLTTELANAKAETHATATTLTGLMRRHRDITIERDGLLAKMLGQKEETR
jgi:hypothetical protein